MRGSSAEQVEVYLDGIPLNSALGGGVNLENLPLSQVSQIEVYRGPQGTLFGKNSTGGVIAITSKRPDLDEFGADVEVTYGQYDRDGSTSDITKFSAGIDVPIIEGVLGFRFAQLLCPRQLFSAWVVASGLSSCFCGLPRAMASLARARK